MALEKGITLRSEMEVRRDGELPPGSPASPLAPAQPEARDCPGTGTERPPEGFRPPPTSPLDPPPPAGGVLPSLVPDSILEGEFPCERPEALAHHLHRRLLSLSSREASLDLALGHAFLRLSRDFSLRDLGHSRPQDYAPARFGFSWAHARELRTLHDKLAGLPLLRRAFLAGSLPRSKLRLLLPVATPETEAGWIVLARRLPVRALRDAVAAFKDDRAATSGPRADEQDLPENHVPLAWSSSRKDAAVWRHWGRSMLRQVMGRNAPDWALLEALCAETLSAFGWPEPEPPSFSPWPPCRQERRRRKRLREKKLVALGRKHRPAPIPPLPELPDPGEARDAWQLQETLLRLVRLRNSLDWQRSRLLLFLEKRALHWELGFPRFDLYLDSALGLSPQEAHLGIELQKRLVFLPLLSAAVRAGEIPCRAASRIARVAEPQTEQAWIEYARSATWRRLDLSVEWLLALRASLPAARYRELTGGLPPEQVPLRRLMLDWREFFGTRERARRARREAAGGVRKGVGQGRAGARRR